jgi:hypothetical protein
MFQGSKSAAWVAGIASQGVPGQRRHEEDADAINREDLGDQAAMFAKAEPAQVRHGVDPLVRHKTRQGIG